MTLDCEFNHNAVRLIQLALSSQPHPAIKPELEALFLNRQKRIKWIFFIFGVASRVFKMPSITSSEVIRLIKDLSLPQRLKIAEDILRNIREESMEKSSTEENKPAILKFAGIIDEEEAKVWQSAVAESRKI